ncbi:hypothetical protein NQ318_012620 [Aromia moschata]|uniref:Uncharacterized protein n=1 Tax=Aromia moschata TaxID=1265417 RepID=A0AAV8XCR7_9CUCU|nr:hypothetical protein NQ318_012620 [Aromia moschata]
MEKPPTTIVSNTFLSHADLSLERQDTRLFALSYVNNASDILVHLQCISDYLGYPNCRCTSVTPAGISASEEGKHPRAYRPWRSRPTEEKHIIYEFVNKL